MIAEVAALVAAEPRRAPAHLFITPRRELVTSLALQVCPRAGQTVGGSAELGGQCRWPRSRAAMLIRIRVLNEQLTGTGFTDQPRS